MRLSVRVGSADTVHDFQFGCWTFIPLSDAWHTLAEDYHDLGLTCPMTPCFSAQDDPEDMLSLLDAFSSYGMRVILYDERITAGACTGMSESEYRAVFDRSLKQFGRHPAVYGYFVGDEPDGKDAPWYFTVARIQREMAPLLVPMLNVLPWFDWIGERIGSAAYAPYLDRAVREGRLCQIGTDCYTQMWEGDKGYEVYFNNLREMRDIAIRQKIHFCMTVLACGHYEYRTPSQDDFRWQISTAAALGASSIFWFYPVGYEPSDNYRQFPINTFGERTERYDWLSEENRLFSARFGKILPGLHCVRSEFTQKPYGGLGKFSPDNTLKRAEGVGGQNLLISKFTDDTGVVYRVVVNIEREKNTEAKLDFAPGIIPEKLEWRERWRVCREYTDPVGTRSCDKATVSMWLAPGQMELLRECSDS